MFVIYMEENKQNKVWSYTIIVETENPKDLENILNNEFQKIAGHRNKIVFYRAEPFANLKEALKERYNFLNKK